MTSIVNQSDRNVGRVLILLLLLGCLLVLRPFVSALLWAIVLSSASWPLYRRMLKWFRNRRTLVALAMTFSMIIVILLPFFVVGSTIGENVTDVTAAAQEWIDKGPPPAPKWLGKVPLVGATATERWDTMRKDTAKLWSELRKFIQPVSEWLVKIGLGLGSGLMKLALSIFITFFLFRHGDAVAERLALTVDHIGGIRGRHLLKVAGDTIRGVVYGILGTSLVQAIVAGIGYVIAGVPDVGLFTLLTFFSSVVPIVGTGLVWVPLAIWLFSKGATGWGIFLLVWGFAVSSLDNFVKPWLISRGGDLPFLLIFFGVVGGAVTFGFLGVFLGPTLLAVGYRLVNEWHAMKRDEPVVTTTPAPSESTV